MVGVVGAWGQLTQGAILRNPRTKYKRSKNVFAVIFIALSCKYIWVRLLQSRAKSLIGSQGTRPAPMNHVKIFKGWPPRDATPKLVQLWYKTFPTEQW